MAGLLQCRASMQIRVARSCWSGRDAAGDLSLSREGIRPATLWPGFVPAIHVFLAQAKQDVDARDKPGHNDFRHDANSMWLHLESGSQVSAKIGHLFDAGNAERRTLPDPVEGLADEPVAVAAVLQVQGKFSGGLAISTRSISCESSW
jgi:hypothetical protein